MERGADVSFLSAFHETRIEVECFYPPLSHLRPTGKHEKVTSGHESGVKFHVVEVRPHIAS